jgi:tRNA pseudouridine38-40 synthase
MRYKVIVQYDGSKYYGFQTQPNHITIQGVIEEALAHIYKDHIKITAASRTDALVHAKHQVFHYDTQTHIPSQRLKDIINNQLPKDIYIIQVDEVDDAFHARYDVAKKEYRYILSTKEFNPFEQHFMTFSNQTLDIDKMIEASHHFIGEHDFKSFAKQSNDKNTVRCVYSFDIDQCDDKITFSIVGNGFLHHMVRIMVGTLLEVGVNHLSPDEVKSILDERNRVYAPFTAPPQGLYLWNIIYKQDEI